MADVWINNTLVITSDNMFHSHRINIKPFLHSGNNQIVIHFKSLTNELSQKRPRPRWKTKLVDNQSLRWIRTTLLGRIPGWTPPVSAVGPWKPIYLVAQDTPQDIHLQTSLDQQVGRIDFNCVLNNVHKTTKACLKIADKIYPLAISHQAEQSRISGEIKINQPKLWWPHTHGPQNLYTAELILQSTSAVSHFPLPAFGFKQVTLDTINNGFKLSVNQQHIFCRGACWTINDILSLTGSQSSLRQTLQLMKDAGANMIRVGGTMVYEQDDFYQYCDELGILVWQDLMFANMDYPFENIDFLSSVTREVKQQLARLAKHACLTLVCGNSEVKQQVSMQGFDPAM